MILVASFISLWQALQILALKDLATAFLAKIKTLTYFAVQSKSSGMEISMF